MKSSTHTTKKNNEKLAQLLKSHQPIWTGKKQHSVAGISTQLSELDTFLPDHGWPNGGLIEVVHEQPGMSQLSLFLPAASALSQQGQGIVFVTPSSQSRADLYAPALSQANIDLKRCIHLQPDNPKDFLSVSEQALRSQTCGAVFIWPQKLSASALHRLHLASMEGQTLAVLFSKLATQNSRSPLRLQLRQQQGTMQLEILKARGSHRRDTLTLPATFSSH